MNDLRFAFRQLAKSPGFTIVAVLTLALGIGVNTTLFSGLNTFLFRPPPYPNAERIVRVYRGLPDWPDRPLSAVEFLALQEQTTTFATVAAFSMRGYNIALPGAPAERVRGFSVSAGLFTVYGVSPQLGRAFTPEEDRPGRDDVAVLGYQFWQTRLGGDPGVIGRTLRIDGENITIIGVMPQGFDYAPLWGWVDLWRPLALSEAQRQQHGNQWLRVVARLQADCSLPQAHATAAVLSAQLAREFPDSNSAATLNVVPLKDTLLQRSERQLSWLTMGLAGFVLLIACANLTNLHLARAIGRGREYALRSALGASRGRLVRQVLAETLLLAAMGGTVAALLTLWGRDLLAKLVSQGEPFQVTLPIDLRVVGFSLFISLGTGVVIGLMPAWIASRAGVIEVLKGCSAQVTATRGQQRLRRMFVAAEIALALVLLAGAGMMLRGVNHLITVGPGWRTSGLLRGEFTLSAKTYATSQQRYDFLARLHEQLANLPGVERVTICSQLPLWGFSGSRSIVAAGAPLPPRGHEPEANLLFVDPDFFATLDLPLMQGRPFAAADGAKAPKVGIINAALARKFWPNENAVGKRIGSPDPANPGWIEIVGVVEEVRLAVALGRPGTPFLLLQPVAQTSGVNMFTVALRSSVPPTSLAQSLRQTMANLDRDLPIQQVTTVQDAIQQGLADTSLVGGLLAAFAGLGLLLAAIGIYGVIASMVAQRTREIGIRFALGASATDVMRLIVGSGSRLAIAGSILGLAGAWGLARLLARAVPRLPAQDLGTVLSVALLLFAVALFACWLPARRAARINPIEALRAE